MALVGGVYGLAGCVAAAILALFVGGFTVLVIVGTLVGATFGVLMERGN